LRQIIDASPDIIYVFELETRRNIFISRRFEEVFGQSREHLRALKGAVLAELIHPEDAARVTAHVNSLNRLADGAVAEVEYRMRTAEGSWRWLSSREVVFARTSEGFVHSVLGVASDITERRKAQNRIRDLDRKLRVLQDEERRRIAADLHDSTAQLLLGASLVASRLMQLIAGGEAEDYIRELKGMLEQALKEIRVSAYLLHPPELESEGLLSVMRQYVAGFARGPASRPRPAGKEARR
jgi:PAS domain S-box-containing protein